MCARVFKRCIFVLLDVFVKISISPRNSGEAPDLKAWKGIFRSILLSRRTFFFLYSIRLEIGISICDFLENFYFQFRKLCGYISCINGISSIYILSRKVRSQVKLSKFPTDSMKQF